MWIGRLMWVNYQEISNCCRPVLTYWLTDWRSQWLTDCWSCTAFCRDSFSLLQQLCTVGHDIFLFPLPLNYHPISAANDVPYDIISGVTAGLHKVYPHFLPRDAMHPRYLPWCCVCPSVRLSVTSRSSTKTAKRRITQTTPHDSPGTLVFWCQRSPRNSTAVPPPYEGAKCRWGGSKFGDFQQITGCILKTV